MNTDPIGRKNRPAIGRIGNEYFRMTSGPSVATAKEALRALEGRGYPFYWGKFKIVGALPAGGVGRAFIALDRLGRECVLKVPNKLDEKILQSFYAERNIAFVSGGSERVVGAREIGDLNGLPYMVMDYVDGKELYQLIYKTPQRRLPARKAIEIALQICEGLSHLHALGLVHKDLKPENVIVRDKTGQAVIMDLGLAVDMKNSETQFICGTPGYASPEQMTGRKLDQHSDIYSLGATLFQMLSGEMPFDEDDPVKLVTSILLHNKQPQMDRLPADLPKELRDAVWKMLQKAPADRYASAEATAEVLRGILAELPQP